MGDDLYAQELAARAVLRAGAAEADALLLEGLVEVIEVEVVMVVGMVVVVVMVVVVMVMFMMVVAGQALREEPAVLRWGVHMAGPVVRNGGRACGWLGTGRTTST